MDIPQLFFTRYNDLRAAVQGLSALTEAQWRARPHGLNSVAWLVWHMARVEDSGLNRLVFDYPQVLDDPSQEWATRMNVPLRHQGTEMTDAEVNNFTVRVDTAGLMAYSAAVAARTRELVVGLQAEALDSLIEPAHLRRVLFTEGMLHPAVDWSDPLPYAINPRGELLLHFGLTHNFGHWHEIGIVRRFSP